MSRALLFFRKLHFVPFPNLTSYSFLIVCLMFLLFLQSVLWTFYTNLLFPINHCNCLIFLGLRNSKIGWILSSSIWSPFSFTIKTSYVISVHPNSHLFSPIVKFTFLILSNTRCKYFKLSLKFWVAIMMSSE